MNNFLLTAADLVVSFLGAKCNGRMDAVIGFV